jgi:hypothetical protein
MSKDAAAAASGKEAPTDVIARKTVAAKGKQTPEWTDIYSLKPDPSMTKLSVSGAIGSLEISIYRVSTKPLLKNSTASAKIMA